MCLFAAAPPLVQIDNDGMCQEPLFALAKPLLFVPPTNNDAGGRQTGFRSTVCNRFIDYPEEGPLLRAGFGVIPNTKEIAFPFFAPRACQSIRKGGAFYAAIAAKEGGIIR